MSAAPAVPGLKLPGRCSTAGPGTKPATPSAKAWFSRRGSRTGAGTLARTGEEVARLWHSRALDQSSPQQTAQARALSDRPGPLSAGVFADATMHTPAGVTDRAVEAAIRRLVTDPSGRDARTEALYAAWCCSTALGYLQTALHHKLAHMIRGHLQHRPCRDPHDPVAAHNRVQRGCRARPAGPDLLVLIADTFGGTPGSALWDLARAAGAPLRLADLGLAEADLDRAAEIAMKNACWNPRPFGRHDLRTLLQAAWQGRRPQA